MESTNGQQIVEADTDMSSCLCMFYISILSISLSLYMHIEMKIVLSDAVLPPPLRRREERAFYRPEEIFYNS